VTSSFTLDLLVASEVSELASRYHPLALWHYFAAAAAAASVCSLSQ
jgi:hypothetical protein